VAQVKPAASNVVAPAEADPEAAAEPAEEAIDSAPEAADPAAEVAAPPADVAALAAEVAAAAADDVLVVLLSLPHALRVNAPAARRAISPLIRVIFTQEPPLTQDTCSWCAPDRRHGHAPDGAWQDWTVEAPHGQQTPRR
jgi:hypothetical protein